MHTTDLSARALAKGDAELTPTERLHELAAILAAGVLRLKTRPGSLSARGSATHPGMPESADAGPENAAEKLSESGRNCLDPCAMSSPHVAKG